MNHSSPQFLVENEAKEDVNVSQYKKILKASEKMTLLVLLISQYRSNASPITSVFLCAFASH